MEKPATLYLFTLPNCPACKRMRPIAEAVCAELRIRFEPVNAKQSPELALRYCVRSAPTLVLQTANGSQITTRTMLSSALKEWIRNGL